MNKDNNCLSCNTYTACLKGFCPFEHHTNCTCGKYEKEKRKGLEPDYKSYKPYKHKK